MIKRLSIPLAVPAHEMAQEEIQKQVAFLSKNVGDVRFAKQGSILELDAPEDEADQLTVSVTALAQRVQRSLRSLQRKVLHRTREMDGPEFLGAGSGRGVHLLGKGQVALEGLALRLFRYFDRVFETMGQIWKADPLLTPTLIPATVLAKCDYFRSFPQTVTFACHLVEDTARIEEFRSAHQDRNDLDQSVLRGLETPEACLSPAVCYHVYHLNHDRVLPAAGKAYGVCGKCFRYESSNMSDLRRLWDFTMREIVFLGSRDDVLQRRDEGIAVLSRFLEDHRLAGEIRTASDPFFAAPDSLGKTYFQLSSETKYEISLLLPDENRLAAGSLNYHTDFFGRAFNVQIGEHGLMHSVCIAFGLERWVHAFLVQHGEDPGRWPELVRGAAEFSG
jgi:seryl-tRNA synthetase